jgi:hypothetical protein
VKKSPKMYLAQPVVFQNKCVCPKVYVAYFYHFQKTLPKQSPRGKNSTKLFTYLGRRHRCLTNRSTKFTSMYIRSSSRSGGAMLCLYLYAKQNPIFRPWFPVEVVSI